MSLRHLTHRKTAGLGDRYGAHVDREDLIAANDPFGAAELRTGRTIVSPEDPEHRTVDVMSRMEMSREEKAGYLAKARFKPQAISAILAQVDRYTETSED